MTFAKLLLALVLFASVPHSLYAQTSGTRLGTAMGHYDNLPTPYVDTDSLLSAQGDHLYRVPGDAFALTYATYADFKAAAAPTSTVATAITRGYHSAGDGGGSIYDWNPTSTAPLDDVFVIDPTGGGTGRWILRVPAEGIHPEQAGAYCDNPIGTTSGHDDTVALNALSQKIQNNGKSTGTIVQNSKKTTGCLINSGDFSLVRGVALKGTGSPLTANGGNPTAFVPFIYVNPAYSLVCSASSSIKNLVVMRAGLATKPLTMEDVYAYQTSTIQDSSIGIKNVGSDCTITNTMVIGFNKGVSSTNGDRLLVTNLYCDDANCLDVSQNFDTTFINDVRGYPFWSLSQVGHLGAYSGTVIGAGTAYTNGDILTVPGGTCATQPKFTAVVSGGAITGFAVNDSGDCTVSPQTYGVSAATVNTGGSGGTNGSQTVTVASGTCTVAPQLNVTISGGAITAVNSVTNPGICTSSPFPISAVTGAGLSGAILNLTMAKNAIALTGGSGTGGTATISTQGSGYRPGACLNIHDRADGISVYGAECQEYQTQAIINNIWDAKLNYIGGEGGFLNADRQMTGILTQNCVADTIIYNPNAGVNYIDLDLQHKSQANGGSCALASNQSASLTVIGGHLGYIPNITLNTIRTGAFSSGILTHQTLGWGNPSGLSTGLPVSVSIGANSGKWLIDDMQFNFSDPTYYGQWISVDPTATPPISNQLSNKMPGSWLVNGDFMIDQYNEGASNTNIIVADKWRKTNQFAAALTAQLQTTGPTGYSNSLLLTSTGSVSPGASQQASLTNIVEGPALSQLGWGTSNAQPVILEGCIKPSITGNYAVALLNGAQTMSYIVNVAGTANTWGCFASVIPGPTTGNWITTPASQVLRVAVDLGAGSSLRAPSAGTWYAATYYTLTGNVELSTNNGATLALGAFHLKPGPFNSPTYTPNNYGDELARAQRYFQKSFSAGTAVGQNKGAAGATTLYTPFTSGNAGANVAFRRSMAGTPTITFGSTSAATANCYDSTAGNDVGAASATNVGTQGFFLSCSLASGSPAAGDQLQTQWWADAGF